MAENYNDANLSRHSGAEEPSGPTRLHHQLATGKKTTGQSDPNGGKGDTANKVAGQKCTY